MRADRLSYIITGVLRCSGFVLICMVARDGVYFGFLPFLNPIPSSSSSTSPSYSQVNAAREAVASANAALAAAKDEVEKAEALIAAEAADAIIKAVA